MEVFKISLIVGDKVKILSNSGGSKNPIGSIGEIVRIKKNKIYSVFVKGQSIPWAHYDYQLEKIEEENKMEIIKFNPTSYEYRDGIHYINFDQEKLVWMTSGPGELTWGNRSVIKIQMNNEGEIINRSHSYYFQLVDGTKRIFRLDDLIRNSDIEDRLIKYLVDSEDEYLFNIMKDGMREVIATDDNLIDKLQNAYEEVENVVSKSVPLVKYDTNTKMKEHEVDELVFEIEQVDFERAINRALDEKDKETFMKLTGGIK